MSELKLHYFLPNDEVPDGFSYPQVYLNFIEVMQPSNRAMVGMFPWIFSGGTAWAKDESMDMFGVQLVPFAEAEDLDMMAFFEVSNQLEPRTWVVNPWESMPELRVYEVFDDFNGWLDYAKKISEEQLELKPHFREDEFWFPKNK